jgi:rod shape-determining protein MreC
MMRRGSQLRATSFLAIAVVLAVVLLSFARVLHLDGMRDVAATVFEPFQAAFTGVGDGIRGAVSTIDSIGRVETENRALKQQVADLQRELTTARQAESTNRQLQQMLDLRAALNIHSIGADVIARDPDGLSPTITIRAGKNNGVRKGMAVLGPRGLVGRVVQVQGGTSQVQLISDPQNPVGVMLAQSHLSGSLRVSEGKMKVDIPSAPVDLRINTGDVLVTSGIGGNYPKGVPVAEVVHYQYQAYGAAQRADATPMDNLNRIEVVMVDLDFVPDIVP